jgi:ACR3 family arsenite efflux pump ArsB
MFTERGCRFAITPVLSFRPLGPARAASHRVAVLIWLMIVSMLLKIDLSAMREVGKRWKGMNVMRAYIFT